MACAGRCCKHFCQEFKEFVLRGSILDLAIGTAFINVIQSPVDDIITLPLGLVLGGVDFANLTN